MSHSAAALRFKPEFQVHINGENAPAALRASISGVSYQTGLEGADRVELTLANENLRWLDHRLLALDNAISLSMGYAPDPLQQMFAGNIVGLSPTFPSSGTPTLTVAAQDRRQRMQQGGQVRWFAISTQCLGNFPIPDTGIASLISAQHGLIPLFDPISAAIATIIGGIEIAVTLDKPDARQKLIRKQAGESDFDFLRRISQENGWELVMEHSGSQGGYKLRFLSLAGNLAPVLTLKYGRSLADFTPRISTVGQVAAVSTRFWEPHIKMEFTITVSWDWDRNALDLRIIPGFGLSGVSDQADTEATKSGNVMLIEEALDKSTAPRALLTKLLGKLNQRLTGSGRCVGDPRITAGTVIRLEGIGEQFGGLYRVTNATHTLDSGGYQTSFEVRKEIWFGSVPLLDQGAVRIEALDQTFLLG